MFYGIKLFLWYQLFLGDCIDRIRGNNRGERINFILSIFK